MEEEKKICTNCKREIPSSNYTIHVVHCVNRLTVCPKCKDSIPRTELNEHMEKFHTEIACESCKEKVEIGHLEHHKKELCCKRLLNCQYCEIEDTADDLKEHENYCGSRTELCNDCGQFIMLKNQEAHLASNHALNQNNFVKENNRKSSQELNDSTLNSISKLKKVSNLSRDAISKFSPSKRTNDMPQINTDATGIKNKDSDKPTIQGRERQLSEDLDALLAFHLTEEDANNYNPVGLPYLMEDLFPRHMQEDIASRNTMFHPNINMPSVWDEDDDSFFLENAYFDEPVPELVSSKKENEATSLPCEFCGKLFSADNLIQHQSGCRPDIAHGPPQELNNTVLLNFNGDEMQSFDDPIPPPYTQETESMINPIDLPCEFCGMLYPSEFLVEHQNICAANESSRESSPVIENMQNESTELVNSPSVTSHTESKINVTSPGNKNAVSTADVKKTSNSHIPFRNCSNPLAPVTFSDLCDKTSAVDLQRTKTNYYRRLPQIRNIPIKISPDYVPHTIMKKEPAQHLHPANGMPFRKDDEESLTMKNYAKHVHKAMNPVRESINKTTGTRPKIQASPEVFRSLENTNTGASKFTVPKIRQNQPLPYSEQTSVPKYLAGISGAEEAYRKYKTSLKNTNPRTNLSPSIQQTHLPTEQENLAHSRRNVSYVRERAGATPKYRGSKPPSFE